MNELRIAGLAALGAWAIGLAGGCGGQPALLGEPWPADRENGRRLLSVYGCIACHQIPGVRGTTAAIGPPLGGIGRRGYVAGRLPNSPDALVRWIMNPQDVAPGTAMPDLLVGLQEARDMVAYLRRQR